MSHSTEIKGEVFAEVYGKSIVCVRSLKRYRIRTAQKLLQPAPS